MITAVENWIDRHEDALISDVRRVVSFNSVSSLPAGPGMPFGKECRAVLDCVGKICSGFGFPFTDMEGYIGYADAGEGEETLGILTHLDVVPAGEGWSSDPFAANVVDGSMIGRGVLDDKGPAICAIYALAAVKNAGIPFKRKVRIIFGCDEEKNMRCLNHYLSNEKVPDVSFAPDAEYPLVNAEKNIFHAQYGKKYRSNVKLTAGTVINAVPAKAQAVLPVEADVVAQAAGNSPWFCFEPAEGGVKATAQGISAHAALPESGINAIQRMLGVLTKLPLPEEDARTARMLWDSFQMEYTGESAGFMPGSGVTLNLGLINWDETGFTVDIDMRAPIEVTEEEILQKLDRCFQTIGAVRNWSDFSKGYHMPEDSELVQALLSVYRKRTGDMTPPKQLGSGTYARHLKNTVAFGPERSNRVSRIHMADEAVPVDDLLEDTKMIADAIIALACRA